MDPLNLGLYKIRKGEVTEYERSEDERLRDEGFDFIRRLRVEDRPAPSTPIRERPTVKLIKVMFMSAPLDTERRMMTRSCTEYLAVDCNAQFLGEYIHCEICFVDIETKPVRKNASFSSSSGTKGVTFIFNKQYSLDKYKAIWDICVTQKRFDLVYKEAEKMVASRYEYDLAAVYCFPFYSCVPERYKTHRHTCATACAQLLAKVGIGSDKYREYLRTDRSIMVDDLYEALRATYEAHPGMVVSKEIIGIQPGTIPEHMKRRE